VGSHFRDGATDVQVDFVVPIPFYRTSWFIGLCVLGGTLLLWLILRLNAARLRRRNLQLEKMVRQRTGELVNANTVLRRSLEMKEMLVSIISHDIVTPLRFIARVSNGAVTGPRRQDPTRLNDTMEDIARSSEKLHANAQGLLQWIKRQDGRIELRMRNVALHPFVDEILAMEQERASDKGIQLVNEVSLDDVVQTDRDVLSIVLHNLLANAVTHTHQGRVTVGGQTTNPGFTLTVSDTGNGMPEAALAHALRLKGQGALGAMNNEGERDVQGLGLLIVADLLQLLGGSFEIQSNRGEGTRVTIGLPGAIASRGQATSERDKTSIQEV
jgi:signal transduction histidine kinase